MTRFLSIAALILVPACALFSQANPFNARPLHVAGEYATAVSLGENSCQGITVEPRPTSVMHASGSSDVTLTHAGNAFPGTIDSSGRFRTTARTLGGSSEAHTLVINGTFTSAGFSATVTADVTRAGSAPCRYSVLWTGTRAQSAAIATPLAPLIGGWSGTGSLMGASSQFSMCWRSVFNGRFVHLRYAVTDPSRKPRFAAEAYYRPVGDSVSGRWFDSRGAEVMVTGTIQGQTLGTKWSNASESGSTQYVVVGDSLIVSDFVNAGVQSRPFASARYGRDTRACAGP